MSDTLNELRARLLTVDQWSREAEAIREQIIRVGTAEAHEAAHERAGAWLFRRPEARPEPEAVIPPTIGVLPSQFLQHKAAITAAYQKHPARANQLVALLSGVDPVETIDPRHYAGRD